MEESRIYDLDGKVLFLGTGYSTNTSFHLAEERASFTKKFHEEGCAVMVDGLRRWAEFEMLILDTDDFRKIGSDFESTQIFIGLQIGKTICKSFKIKDLINFGIDWISRNRK